MKTRPAILLLCALCCCPALRLQAQVNLVPNFGFEQYDTCPDMEDQVQYCTGWSKYSASSTTPDYYNACSPYYFSVPQNQAQYQLDHRNCGAYMGLCTWASNPVDYREQIGIQLSQPLVVGQKYYLSFYTVNSGANDGTQAIIPSNNIGMRLSTVAYSSQNPAPIDNFANLRSTSIISDTSNWMRISGSIVADSAYQYLMLGNFYDDANTDTTTLTCGTCVIWYGYYLIDDVCISTDSVLCNGGIDALPCVESVEENSFNKQFTLYPNPANSFVMINSDLHTAFDIEVYNSIGQLLYAEENVNSNNLQLDISHYNSSLLFIKITSQNNQLMYKLLKQ